MSRSDACKVNRPLVARRFSLVLGARVGSGAVISRRAAVAVVVARRVPLIIACPK